MNIILDKIANAEVGDDFCRLFHGRGGCYPSLDFITVDSIKSVLNIAFFKEPDEVFEKEFFERLLAIVEKSSWSCVLLQRRYVFGAPSEYIWGELPENNFAVENGLRYKLNLLNNRNSGFFPDMVNGRTFVRENCCGKRVLNLFSYSCSFSVVAIAGGADYVVNVDMSKSALSTGRENHRINCQSTENVSFMPYNILKSWGRIKKKGPYDLIIIDPPTLQKGSFVADKDYVKILRKLSELSSDDCIVLSALNSPDHDTDFLKQLFAENCPDFSYEFRLDNSAEFPSLDYERSLKCLIFKRRS